MDKTKRLWAVLAAAMVTMGCTQHHGLQDSAVPHDNFYGNAYQQVAGTGEFIQHQQPADSLRYGTKDCRAYSSNFAAVNYRADQIISDGAEHVPLSRPTDPHFHGTVPLSPGDLVSLSIENGDGFSGNYVVNTNGLLVVPYLEPMMVFGLPIELVAEKIELALVRAELFRPATARVDLRLLQWSDIEVTVSGAVFEPGRVRINRNIPEQVLEQRINAYGDYSGDRMLSEALRAASGIRPDAKLDQVTLMRSGWQVQLDMSGVMTGTSSRDIALVAGDRIVVPSTGCFQPHLVRPTQITPKGLRVFMSNLIDSAANNSSAAVGRFSSNMPYGSRLLQAAVSANCIGGKQWTNAPRKVLLAGHNPLTGQVQVIERSVEQLMRQPHIAAVNPYLMPNDAVACYDSDLTNLRDIARSLVDVISPFKLL
ncbi:polysaccharide biosynthesis/export family protein [Ferrimonas lipolytica]|uniref:Polysaccharide export protein n=1 Tax=Ferrimonas lipolytica TaxID=2724191 RepID=A0A6H1UCQ1_9GAMM|nr:polysaccharide export protein [Ferrimonas lipolytica]QIZ76360.1 polysaccharide export protein [Ferrimonas lipolytica]